MPDLQERMTTHTLPYLAALLNCTEAEAWGRPITWQVFDDTPAKDPKKARIDHGTLEQLALDYDRRNQDRCGIFITVNQTDLAGRKKANVVALRAAWADLDDKGATEDLDLAALPLEPSLVVRSGHGCHLYWIFPDPIPCDERRRNEHEAMLRGIQKVLAPQGADPKVCFVQTVLRVPGFYNMKAEPVLVEVIR